LTDIRERLLTDREGCCSIERELGRGGMATASLASGAS
jgi:hypothetical protein